MKGIRTIRRYFRDARKSLIRNFSLSLASISCITITLIVVAISMVISNNVDSISSKIKKDVTMIVFIDNDATQEEIDDIGKKIKAMSNVDTMTFKSKQDAADELGAGEER